MTTPERALAELRAEIDGYAPEDDGYILLRPSQAWRIHDALAASQERVRALETRAEALRDIASGTWKRGDLHSALLDSALASGDKDAFRFGFMSWAQALARKAQAVSEPPWEG